MCFKGILTQTFFCKFNHENESGLLRSPENVAITQELNKTHQPAASN